MFVFPAMSYSHLRLSTEEVWPAPWPDPSPSTGKQLCTQNRLSGPENRPAFQRPRYTKSFRKIALHFPLFRLLIFLFYEQNLAVSQTLVGLFVEWLPGRKPRSATDRALRTQGPRGWSAMWPPPLQASVSSSVRMGWLYNPQHPFQFSVKWPYCPMWHNRSICLIMIKAQTYRRMNVCL